MQSFGAVAPICPKVNSFSNCLQAASPVGFLVQEKREALPKI